MSITDAGIEAGQRWMLKFEVGYFGTIQDPDTLTRKPVLRLISYSEIVNTDKKASLPAIVIKSPKIKPILLAEESSQPARSDLPSDSTSVSIMTNQPASASLAEMKQLHNVAFFENNRKYQALVDLSTNEPNPQPHMDIRFKAILRSISVSKSSPLPIQDAAMKIAWVENNKANIIMAESDLGSPAKNGPDILVPAGNTNGDKSVDDSEIDPAGLLTSSNILPIFFMEQRAGFFLVAELDAGPVENEESTLRRLLVSIFVHDDKDSQTGRQMYIITPRYDMMDLGKLYTVGFHQDTNGPISRLEFVLGREDTFRQFATYNLKNTDHIYFKTAKGSEPSNIGIGCWPSWPEAGSTLYFNGYIKEVICDPYSNCTSC